MAFSIASFKVLIMIAVYELSSLACSPRTKPQKDVDYAIAQVKDNFTTCGYRNESYSWPHDSCRHYKLKYGVVIYDASEYNEYFVFVFDKDDVPKDWKSDGVFPCRHDLKKSQGGQEILIGLWWWDATPVKEAFFRCPKTGDDDHCCGLACCTKEDRPDDPIGDAVRDAAIAIGSVLGVLLLCCCGCVGAWVYSKRRSERRARDARPAPPAPANISYHSPAKIHLPTKAE